ncbi:36467_t:CDS:2 [Gigaspora margarita]|uniref:36467_t:CDS:1 n=1 Tax=Gigaspora margarita TaxID=4874 RepID=A0ABN7VF04_GIGMA|nr:36467_t:CDS:2 [Gigaspora margarita]
MYFRFYKKLMALKHDLKNIPLVLNVVQLNLDFKNNPLLSNVVRNVAFSKNLIIIAGAGISCSGGIPITQVVQLYGTLANLQYNVCTNVYSFTQEYCDIFMKGEIPNCTECEKREYKRNLQGKRKHTIGQLKLAVILYGDKHSKELEIGEIAAYNQDKNSRGEMSYKKFAEAVHDRNGYVIMMNATNVVTKEWNEIIDYQIKGICDEWVKLIDMELSNVKKSKKRKRNEIDHSLNFTNNNSLRNKKKSLTK